MGTHNPLSALHVDPERAILNISGYIGEMFKSGTDLETDSRFHNLNIINENKMGDTKHHTYLLRSTLMETLNIRVSTFVCL